MDQFMKTINSQVSALAYHGPTPPAPALQPPLIPPIESEYPVEYAEYADNYNKPQNNPYSGTYNPGFRNHPEINWGVPQWHILTPVTTRQPHPPPNSNSKLRR